VKRDDIEAYSWLLLANALGAMEARAQLENLVPKMSEHEINSAKKRAKNHMKQFVMVLR
jgi:hypothetical protein